MSRSNNTHSTAASNRGGSNRTFTDKIPQDRDAPQWEIDVAIAECARNRTSKSLKMEGAKFGKPRTSTVEIFRMCRDIFMGLHRVPGRALTINQRGALERILGKDAVSKIKARLKASK